MLLIRRLWLLPAFLVTLCIYWVIREVQRPITYEVKSPSNNADGLLHWVKQPERFPIARLLTPARGRAAPMPKIQFAFDSRRETHETIKIRDQRREAVKESFKHSWEGYKEKAWTKDEVAPVSGAWRSSFGGWGATMVDAMDTLWIMGMKEDFDMCVEAVKAIDFTTNTEDTLNVFETTIRYMGGLLAAYDVGGKSYKPLLHKARELGEILYTAFDTENRMPATRWEWRKSAKGHGVEASPTTLLAELGSLSLEFTRLSQLTGDAKFFDATKRISNELERLQLTTQIPGLWPTIVDAKNLTADYNHFTFGGMADSTYEYLPKQHILAGGRATQYQDMYEEAIAVAKKRLFFRPMTPTGEDILFSGNIQATENGESTLDPQGQHLTCFVAGMVGIGSRIFARPEDLDVARRLVDGCIWAYNAMPSGLMPETFRMVPCHIGTGLADSATCKWSESKWYEHVAEVQGIADGTSSLSAEERGKKWVVDANLFPGFTDIKDPRYILRPEAIESIFIMYRITGDVHYQEVAWKMFQSIEKATRTDIAAAAVGDVREVTPYKSDRMESFWLAETLKYFFLIFSEPKILSLDDWVFNTEAHPLKQPTIRKL